MPAAAVIPALIAYIKVVAVEKLLVEFLVELCWCLRGNLYNTAVLLLLQVTMLCN